MDRVRHKNIRDAIAVIRTPSYVLLPAILFLLVPDILQVACPVSVSSAVRVLVLGNGLSGAYVEMLANMSRTAQVEYTKYHGLTVPGAVANKAAGAGAGTCKAAAIARSTSISTAPFDFHKCTLTPGSAGSSSAAGMSSAGWLCACGKICPSGDFLFRHRRMCASSKATPIHEEEEEEEEEIDEAEGEDDATCMDVSKVQGEVLQAYGELHYEHFLSGAAVQQHKAASNSVTMAQSTAIKRALRGKLMPGVDLDSIINPIMDAAEKYRHKGTEQEL